MQGGRFSNRLLPYILVSPSTLIIIVFLIVPFFQSLYMSFFRVSPFGTTSHFVKFDNFGKLFTSGDYLNSLSVTMIFAVIVVGFGLAISLGIAVLANQKVGGLGFYQIALIWPYALSPAVAGTIWALLFAPSTGIIPYVVSVITGGYTLNWMTNGPLALIIMAVAATWKMSGYNIVFFLAGLQNIPENLLEAAAIDGAGSFKRFWKITFPLLSPITFFLFIMNTLYAFFQVFGLVDIMTHGGPGNATEVLVYKLYRDSFIFHNTGYASAQSVVLFLGVAILIILQFRLAGRRVFYAR